MNTNIVLPYIEAKLQSAKNTYFQATKAIIGSLVYEIFYDEIVYGWLGSVPSMQKLVCFEKRLNSPWK